MQSDFNIPTRATSNKIAALRSASKHIAQAKLLIRRAADEDRDPLEIRTLRDLAGVLQYVIVAIEHEASR
jgi:hypothetical protein